MHCSKTFCRKTKVTKNKLKTKKQRSKTHFPQAAFFLHGYFPNADLMEGRLSLPALSCSYSSTVCGV